MELNSKKLAIAIFVLALTVRLSVLLIRGPSSVNSPWDFSFEDGVIAEWIASGHGFSSPYYDYPRPTAVMAPAYPYWLALVFSIFEPYSDASAWVVLLLQAFLGSMACIILFRFGAVVLDIRSGLISGLMFALYPVSIYYSCVQIGPTVLTSILLISFVWLIWKLREEHELKNAFVGGFLMAAGLLVKPAVLTAMLASLAWYVFTSTQAFRKKLVFAAVCIGTAAVVISPWTIRNRVELGQWVPLKTPFGLNLFFGNHPYSEGVVQDTESVFTEIDTLGLRMANHPDEARNHQRLELIGMAYDEFAERSEVEQDHQLRLRASQFISENPSRFLKLCALRLFYFWWPVNPYRPTPYDALRWLSYGVPAVLAVIGFFLWPLKSRSKLLLLFTMAAYPVPYLITHVSFFRYRFPIEPFLLLAASVTLKKLFEFINLESRLRNSNH